MPAHPKILRVLCCVLLIVLLFSSCSPEKQKIQQFAYVKDGNIFLSNADGSDALTHHPPDAFWSVAGLKNLFHAEQEMLHQGTFDYVNTQFQSHYGVTPYIVRETSWTGVNTYGEYTWGVALTVSLSSDRKPAFASIIDHALHLAPTQADAQPCNYVIRMISANSEAPHLADAANVLVTVYNHAIYLPAIRR